MKHWSPLPNVGGSCHLAAALKLLCTMPLAPIPILNDIRCGKTVDLQTMYNTLGLPPGIGDAHEDVIRFIDVFVPNESDHVITLPPLGPKDCLSCRIHSNIQRLPTEWFVVYVNGPGPDGSTAKHNVDLNVNIDGYVCVGAVCHQGGHYWALIRDQDNVLWRHDDGIIEKFSGSTKQSNYILLTYRRAC